MPGPPLGSYNLTLAGNAGAWLVGPIFQGGETVRIQAYGSIRFALPVSPTVVPSSPSTYTFDLPGLSETFTFAIPAGLYCAAYWSLAVTDSAFPGPGATVALTAYTGAGATDGQTLLSGISNGSFSVSNQPVTAPQLADINAAAGGNLGVAFQVVGSGFNGDPNPAYIDVTSFTLTLVPAGYAFPEGAYPPNYPATHAYDPSAVLQDGAWTGSPPVCPNIAPVSLAAIVLPDGTRPPFTSGFSPALQPNQDTTFSASQLAAAGAADPGQVYRLWFVFNDGISADLTLISGSYSLTVTRYGAYTPMAEPYVSFIRPQFGVESSYGTQQAAARILNCIENGGFLMQPEQTKASRGLAGLAFDTDDDLTTETSKDTVKGWLDFNDFPYFLQCRFGSIGSTSPATGVYQWTAEDNVFNPIVPVSYSFELPTASGERAQGVVGCVWDGIKIDTERDKQFTASFGIKGKQLSDNITPSAGQNDVQTVTVNGAPTGGTFYLVVDNMPTATIAYNAAASAVQTAIRAVGGDWSGATVSGSTGGPWTVTNVLGKLEPTLQAVYGGLTGGTTPTVTVAHTALGGMKINASSRVLPNMLGVGFATDLTTLINAPTIVTDEFSTSIDVGEVFAPLWRQNTTDVQNALFTQKKASEIKDMVTLNMAYNSQVANFISNSRSGTKMYVRLTFGGSSGSGAQIGSSGYYQTIYYDFCAEVTWKANKDSQGNVRSVDFDMNVKHNTSDGFRSRWTVINGISSYAS